MYWKHMKKFQKPQRTIKTTTAVCKKRHYVTPRKLRVCSRIRCKTDFKIHAAREALLNNVRRVQTKTPLPDYEQKGKKHFSILHINQNLIIKITPMRLIWGHCFGVVVAKLNGSPTHFLRMSWFSNEPFYMFCVCTGSLSIL